MKQVIPHETRDASHNPVNRLGFWAAILTAVFALGWFVAVPIQNALAPTPTENAAAYVMHFRPLEMLTLYPSILLPIAFIALLCAIYFYAPQGKRVWALLALAIGIVYAVVATVNYLIQLIAVQPSLLAGESSGLDMFVRSNPHSIFQALAAAYVYNALAMFFAALVFEGGGIERWVKWPFFIGALDVPLQIIYYITGSLLAITVGGILWVIGLAIGCIALAILFRKDPILEGQPG